METFLNDSKSLSDFLRFNQPCSYRINGFRLVPEAVILRDGSGYTFIWVIQPNKSDVKFHFTKLSLAKDFAMQYQNNHSSDFWFNLWRKYRTYHYDMCLRLVSKTSYLL